MIDPGVIPRIEGDTNSLIDHADLVAATGVEIADIGARGTRHGKGSALSTARRRQTSC